MNWVNEIHHGDCRALMRKMIRDGVQVQCVITSPPYWGLRDYGHERQFGLEPTPRSHVLRLRHTFALVRDLLRKDGTLWLNYGDTYASSGGSGWQGTTGVRQNRRHVDVPKKKRTARGRLKPKDLMGMAWRIAFALQDDGWYFRSPIIWHKLNPMPESAKDRPTTAHEYVFLMAKRRSYFYDHLAVREPASENTHPRRAAAVTGWDRGPGSHTTILHAAERDTVPEGRRNVAKFGGPKDIERDAAGMKDSTRFGRGAGFRTRIPKATNMEDSLNEIQEDRSMRTVWTFATESFKGAHFATFPRALVERCILAGTRPGDIVFDPFMGTGTVAEVAASLGRRFIGCEISAKYINMFKRYRSSQIGLALEVCNEAAGR